MELRLARPRLGPIGCGLILFLLLPCIGPPALAAKKTKDKVYAEPQPDKALVYVLRKGRFAGSARSMFVYADDQSLGVVDSGSYTFKHLDPGRYMLWTNWTRLRKEVDLVGGHTYYVEPWGKGIELLSEADGKALLDKIESYATPTPKELATIEQQLVKRFAKAKRRESKLEKAEVEEVAAVSRPESASHAVAVPGSTLVKLELKENVTSYLNAAGDAVLFTVTEDVVADEHVAVAAGTVVEGTIRMRQKARMGGKKGGFDIVVPWIEASDGTELPMLGRVEGTGRRRRAAAAAAMGATAAATTLASGGLFWVGVAFNKGKEAFLLNGEEYHVWTREDHWLSTKVPENPPSAAEGGSKSDLSLEARCPGEVTFAPQKHREVDAIRIDVQTDSALQDVRIVSISGWDLPNAIESTSSEFQEGRHRFEFHGWDLVRFMKFESLDGTVPVILRGKTVRGVSFTATVEVPVAIKLPKPKT